MISDLDGQTFTVDDIILLGRVRNEIESWIDEGSRTEMKYDAQFDFLHAVGSIASGGEQWDDNAGVGSFKTSLSLLLTPFNDAQEGKNSFERYISILRGAYADGEFSDEERTKLSTVIQDCEELSTANTGNDYHTQLDLLHPIFDTYIARYSIGMAIQVCTGLSFSTVYSCDIFDTGCNKYSRE